MTHQPNLEKYPVYFWILFALTSAMGAIYNTYLPVYLNQAGFSGAMTGTLLAVGPFVSLIAQPFWGTAGDRTKSTNTLLRWIIAGSGLAAACYPIFPNYFWLLGLIMVFTFFNSPIFTIQDVITLQAIEGTGWKYGKIRLGAVAGFAAFAAAAGWIADWRINYLFPFYAVVACAAFISTYKIPPVKGHQLPGQRLSPLRLLRDRPFTLLVMFNFIIMLSYSFYAAYFSIYYRQIGGDNRLIGLTWFLSALVEIPFLLTADKIIAKWGYRITMTVAAAVMGLRWLLLFIITDPYAVLLVNLMHGFSLIVTIYCMANYINQQVPKELKASGQSLNAVFGLVITRIIASLAGGIAIDTIGLKMVFLCSGLLNFLAIAVFGSLFYLGWRKASGTRSRE